MIGKRELEKLAALDIPAVIQSMDLEQLFGVELYELGYNEDGDWVHECLEKVKARAIAKLTPKVLRE